MTYAKNSIRPGTARWTRRVLVHGSKSKHKMKKFFYLLACICFAAAPIFLVLDETWQMILGVCLGTVFMFLAEGHPR